LHLLWAGPEAVYVFFVLSGFVLARPFLEPCRSWSGYYAKRLVRLYLPMWGAVGLAVVLAVVIARNPVPDGSWWLNQHHRYPVDARTIGRNASVINGANFLDSPLWSLRWEVYFSLLLPAYCYVVRSRRDLWPHKLVLALALISLGVSRHNDFLTYLPMFAIGVLGAQEIDRIVRPVKRSLSVVVLVFALALMTCSWWTPLPRSAAVPIEVLAAATVVWLFLTNRSIGAFAQRAPVAALGRISFSLYLIHEPILVAFTFAFGPIGTLAALPTAIAAACVFYRLVERPAQRLGQRAAHNTARQMRVEPATA
jgi:peptidoglycan/LPS O-acetylase OafA/YrhL